MVLWTKSCLYFRNVSKTLRTSENGGLWDGTWLQHLTMRSRRAGGVPFGIVGLWVKKCINEEVWINNWLILFTPPLMMNSVFWKCCNFMSSYGTYPPIISDIITPKLNTSTLFPYNDPPLKTSGAYLRGEKRGMWNQSGWIILSVIVTIYMNVPIPLVMCWSKVSWTIFAPPKSVILL